VSDFVGANTNGIRSQYAVSVCRAALSHVMIAQPRSICQLYNFQGDMRVNSPFFFLPTIRSTMSECTDVSKDAHR
jgi:hypothetical protein